MSARPERAAMTGPGEITSESFRSVATKSVAHTPAIPNGGSHVCSRTPDAPAERGATRRPSAQPHDGTPD
eukprot:5658003-Alexandrium_andersonii.AAC.1